MLRRPLGVRRVINPAGSAGVLGMPGSDGDTLRTWMPLFMPILIAPLMTSIGLGVWAGRRIVSRRLVRDG